MAGVSSRSAQVFLFEVKMAKRFTDTEKYKKRFVRGLQGAYKLLWDYLYHDCDHAGIWYVDFEIAQIYLGKDMLVNEEEALKQFNNGECRIIVLDKGKKWFVPSFVKFQYGILNPENRAHNSVINLLLNSGVDKGLITSLQGRKDKDKDMDMEKDSKGKPRKRFIPPTIEEVKSYCEERKNQINANAFIDHYESKGWFIGKNKMNDWRAAVRTWENKKKEGEYL